MDRFPLFGKFLPWANDAWKEEGGPPWWQAYNNSKHNAYKCATQRNVIDRLAGLFCLHPVYYGKEVQNFPLPGRYDHPTAVPLRWQLPLRPMSALTTP